MDEDKILKYPSPETHGAMSNSKISFMDSHIFLKIIAKSKKTVFSYLTPRMLLPVEQRGE